MMATRRKGKKRSKRTPGPKRPPAEELEEALGYRFADQARLERALVHRSWAHEKGTPGDDSELLEFLGDSVLSLGVSGILYKRYAGAVVGDLARTRAFLVSESNLARKARSLGLGEHLRLGRGEEKGGGRDKDSLLADAYEAVLAAIYLDGGLEAALSLIGRQFNPQIARLKPGARSSQDFKTDLQETLQAVGLPVPDYRVTRESGPDHRKSFAVEVVIAGKAAASGSGTSKKSAEQVAARNALNRIKELIPNLTEAPADPAKRRGSV